MTIPIVWTIAGSDSSGGAGIQADLKTFDHLGVHGCSVITAITMQNHDEINAIQFSSRENISAQIAGIANKLPPKVIKLGMLGTRDAINAITSFLKTYTGQVILDPIIMSTSNYPLFDGDMKHYIENIKTLFPYIDLLTPNIPEVEWILGKKIVTYQDIEMASKELLSLGLKNVLIKGGHFNHTTMLHDYWSNGVESFWLSHSRAPFKNYRGSGCVLSSAIAATLALGYSIQDALVIAKMYLNQGIRLAQLINEHNALITHSDWPQDEIDLPYLSHHPIQKPPLAFNDCGKDKLGLYPIVDSSDWVEKLLSQGIKTIQLRIKNKTINDIEDEIKKSVHLANQYQARLFVNDFWELAILHGAYGVHLGQDDLKNADVEKIYQAQLRLGISTHCYYEVASAYAKQPSYFACGPIFPTDSKLMPFAPQGVSALKYWRNLLKNRSLVAIGGIDQHNLQDVLTARVDGVAVISAITKANDPMEKTKMLLHMLEQYS